ncbi:MAG: hypothetical protein P0116_14430, partial [Candidatus Nitrosocosmicus sp.]|nr:hypothetical protein [Candidatus Nitrosocosmicus sp.]
DNTNYFTKKGTINFYVPPDFKKSKLLGSELFWIKIEDTDNLFEGNFHLLPSISGLYHNTTICLNSSIVENEVLFRDESNLDDVKFAFLNKPVISSTNTLTTKMDTLNQGDEEEVWIREDKHISNDEREFLLKNNRLLEINDPRQRTTETWIRWMDMNDSSLKTGIYDKGPLENFSRRYYIDRVNGVLTFEPIFESNLQNMRDSNNLYLNILRNVDLTSIKAIRASYRTGGGSFGNIQEAQIKKLKSLLSSIDSVINNAAGEGGSNVQTVENAMEKWPHIIQSKNQAVTFEDYENLVENKFMSVLDVKCFPTTDKNGLFKPGHILVVIIPKLEDKNKKPNTDNNRDRCRG